MKNKRTSKSLGILCLVILVGGFMFWKYYRIPKDCSLTEAQIISQTSSIAKTYGKFYSKSQLLDDGKGGKRVEIKLYQSSNKSHKPIELYAVFDSFIYLSERVLPYDISAVSCHLQESYVIEGPLDDYISVSYDEYKTFYGQIDTNDKKRKDIIAELSDIWLSNEFYYRHALDLTPENEYKKELLTEWQTGISSLDKDFSISYHKSRNGLALWSHSGSIQKISDQIPIDEKDSLYGAWDEQNNIWLFGETMGVQVYSINEGLKCFKNENLDTDKMPYSLKMVVDYYLD